MATVDQRDGEEARRLARTAANMATERVDLTQYEFVCDAFAEELAERAQEEDFTIDVGTEDVKRAFEEAGYEMP
jgi:hypothetical protein